jgi:GNAT superfamily N-acetyltransferase
MIRIEQLSGAALEAHLAGLARLRIEVFRAYPYLYDGDPDYEAWYLADFARADGAVVIAALDGGALIGAATASPMRAQKEAFRAPIAAAGLDPDALFYFGESVLLASYRGHGIGHRFFDAREAAARAQGFRYSGFYGVVRPVDHPCKPEGYSPLNAFWAKRGYQPLAGAVASFPWKDVGQAEETDHPMQFWSRAL